VELRVEGRVGVGNGSSVCWFRNELKVDDLPRMPNLCRDGEDVVDADDPFLNSGTAGAAKDDEVLTRAPCAECEGDGRGEGDAPWATMPSTEVGRRESMEEDSTPGI
jgi:hypothetical protein